MSTENSLAPEDTEDPEQPKNLVAESLLSLFKDNRYIQQCQDLLLDALEPIVGSNNVSEVVKTGTWYASYLLYLHLVVARSGRSLGMESVGLKFSETNNRKRMFVSLWVLGLSSYFLDYYFASASTPSSDAREALRGTNQRRMHQQLRQQMLRRSTQQPTENQNSTTRINSQSQAQ
jgi:hypothetical protein